MKGNELLLCNESILKTIAVLEAVDKIIDDIANPDTQDKILMLLLCAMDCAKDADKYYSDYESSFNSAS